VTTIEKKTDEIFGRACPDRIIIYIINEKKKLFVKIVESFKLYYLLLRSLREHNHKLKNLNR